MNRSRRGPLTGIRVLDLGQYIAGPAAAMMLADQGAEVIRVDPLDGPRWKSPANAVLNRGKASIKLDLQNAAEQETLRRLAGRADVFIENSRPGAMARLGLGADDLTMLNPRLVYLSLPGFCSLDEKAAGVRAWEGVVAATGGIFSDMSVHRRLYGAVPSYSALVMPSANAATLGVLGILVALYHRRRTGRGDIIEVSLLAALQECTPFNTMRIHDMPGRYLSDAEHELARRRVAGEPFDMSFADVDELRDPFYARYVCSDGRPFFVCCVGHRGHIERLLVGLDLWDGLVAEGLPRADPFTSSRDWGSEAEGNTVYAYPLKGRWARRIRELLRRRFATRTSVEWEAFFSEQRIPGVADHSLEEWLACEHGRESGLVIEVNDPTYGRMLQPGPYFWVRGGHDAYRHQKPANLLDADREAILAGLENHILSAAAPEPDAAGTRSAGAPAPSMPVLTGLRILDLSNVIAGPTAAGVLTRFGAECIKLDRPYPELDPGLSVMYSLHCSRGKRSMMLDVTRPEGREVFRELLETVDVVVYNGLDRQLRSLGIDLESLKSVNPRIVLCRVSAFGGPSPGPRSGEPGYDECAQSLSGLTVRNGGSLETAEETASVGCLDNLCGFLGSCAIMTGLLERTKGEEPVQVETSLTATSQLLQIPYLYRYEGRPPFDEPAGPKALGEHALYRLYPTADDWIFFAATPQQLEALRELPEFADLPSASGIGADGGTCTGGQADARSGDAVLAARLEAGLRLRPSDEWVSTLIALGIGAAAVQSYDDLVDSRLVPADADVQKMPAPVWVRHDQHPSGYVIDQVAQSGIRMVNARIDEPGDPPKFGAQTREILAELGRSDEEIGALMRSGTARETWGAQYLPD
jgi:crotonobetainyl-CoA:carnitine CoA-transferase CaiB-like acyl-CoA transferase